MRILAEIDADIGCEQMAAEIFKAIKASADIEAEQALTGYHKWAQQKRQEQQLQHERQGPHDASQQQQQQQQHAIGSQAAQECHNAQGEQQQQQQQVSSTDCEYVRQVVRTCDKAARILRTEEGSTTALVEKSLRLQETMVDLCRQWLGPEHPETLSAILALVEDQSMTNGYLGQSYKKFELVIAKRTRMYGAEHEETLRAKGGLAEMLEMCDAAAEDGSTVAETMGLPLRKELAETWERVYGLGHEETRDAYSALGQCHEMLDMMAEALQAFEREALSCEACFGTDDEDTADALSRVASVMEESFERFLDALPIRRKVLEIRKKVLGADHQRTRRAAEEFAECLESAGLPGAGHLERDIFVSSL